MDMPSPSCCSTIAVPKSTRDHIRELDDEVQASGVLVVEAAVTCSEKLSPKRQDELLLSAKRKLGLRLRLERGREE